MLSAMASDCDMYMDMLLSGELNALLILALALDIRRKPEREAWNRGVGFFSHVWLSQHCICDSE